jgi:hypothetical protein
VQILPTHGLLYQYCSTSSEVPIQVIIHVFILVIVLHTLPIYSVQVAEQNGINEELFAAHYVAVDGVDVVHQFQRLEHVSIVVEAEKRVEARSGEDYHEEGQEEGMEAATEVGIDAKGWRCLH